MKTNVVAMTDSYSLKVKNQLYSSLITCIDEETAKDKMVADTIDKAS